MKIVIFCGKRTGSTFLQDALGSHPNIMAYDEMFMIKSRASKRQGMMLYKTKRKRNEWSVDKYLKWLYSKGDNVVFKLIYDQAFRWDVLPVLNEMDVTLIHLIRRNKLKRAVSRFTKNIYEIQKLDVTPKELLEEVKKGINKQKKVKKALKNYKNIIELYYEDLIGETKGKITNIKQRGAFNIQSDAITYIQEDIAKSLCKKLKVSYHPLYSNLTKKNSEDVWKYIRNKKEVVRLFKSNGLGKVVR